MSLPEGNPRIPEGINASEENPLKEFAQLALGVTAGLVILIIVLSIAIQWLAPFIPFSWEAKASPAIAGYVEEQPDNLDAAEAAIEKLARQLLQTSLQIDVDGESAAELVPASAFHFHLVDADAPNAFATLGANVMVTDEILDKVSSENGLAMVIAHEIAHVQLRHPIQAAGRGIVVQLTLMALLGNNMLGEALSTGGVLTVLSFNRDMELEADARALEILRLHYGHTRGADEFFVAMDGKSGSEQWLEFTETHPSTERRLERINEALDADLSSVPVRELPPALRLSEPQSP